MNEITLKDFLECIDYRITEGSKYQWECFGENAMFLDHWNGKHDETGVSIQIVFDTVDQTVYEMQAWDYKNGREYRWINSNFVTQYLLEGASRNVDTEQSYDDHKFIDLDEASDILEKARAIFLGKEYDERVVINLEMTREQELMLMRAAHAMDMSVNAFVEMALRDAIANG